MRISSSTFAGLLIAAGAAAAIAAAPAAVADPCDVTGAGGGIEGGETTVCSSPGNVEIDSRPSVFPTEGWGGYGMFPWEDGFWVM